MLTLLSKSDFAQIIFTCLHPFFVNIGVEAAVLYIKINKKPVVSAVGGVNMCKSPGIAELQANLGWNTAVETGRRPLDKWMVMHIHRFEGAIRGQAVEKLFTNVHILIQGSLVEKWIKMWITLAGIQFFSYDFHSIAHTV